MLIRQKRFIKLKRTFTLAEAFVIIMTVHLLGIITIWGLPIAIKKAKTLLVSCQKTPISYQPRAPYSDALERALLTLHDWNKTDKQLVGLDEKFKKDNKHKQITIRKEM